MGLYQLVVPDGFIQCLKVLLRTIRDFHV